MAELFLFFLGLTSEKLAKTVIIYLTWFFVFFFQTKTPSGKSEHNVLLRTCKLVKIITISHFYSTVNN